MSTLKPRERDTIIQALSAGVVPKVGLRHIQVGRAREVEAMVKDVERIGEGGATIRFIIGEYGSGKTFFMSLARLIALEKGLVVMFADLAPERRLHASGGQARNLYSELARNLATRTMPEGGALKSVVERFVSQAHREAESEGLPTTQVIRRKLSSFEELTGGFAFAEVIAKYWQGDEAGDEELKSAALRWLRGEFATKTEARQLLGVRSIVDDASFYDQLKLMSAFVKEAGYKGLLVGLDEMVNLLALSAPGRKANHEQILRILNDVLQGSARHLGFLMGGTPEFLTHTHRGLYSYQALQSRLAENQFARDGLVDVSGPVIRLSSLTPEDLFVLLQNIRAIMQSGDSSLPDSALEGFMAHCNQVIGESYFRTPRNTITAFVNLLSVLNQNPGVTWESLLSGVKITRDSGGDFVKMSEQASGLSDEDDELSSFRL